MKADSVNNKETAPFYMEEFFNVEFLYKSLCSANNATARIPNALLEEVNKKYDRLPKYVIAIFDKDQLNDIEDLSMEWVELMIPILTN